MKGIMVCLVLLLAAGCFWSREEVKQVDDVSCFMFTGITEGASLSVKEEGQFVWRDIALKENERYVIKPGVYEVMVTRGSIQVVHRKIFLDSGKTAEIHIP